MIRFLDLDENWIVTPIHGVESIESGITSSNLDFSSALSLIHSQSQVLDKLDYLMIRFLDLDENWIVAPIHGMESTDSGIASSNLDFSSALSLIHSQSHVLDKSDDLGSGSSDNPTYPKLDSGIGSGSIQSRNPDWMM